MFKQWLSNQSMYFVMYWYLLALILVALALSFFHILPYKPELVLFNAVYLISVCFLTNELFGKLFKVSPNMRSALITGAILTLLITPTPIIDHPGALTIIPIVAMASKYLITYHGRHIFNPAAFGVTFGILVLGYGASWWVGNQFLLPFVILGGLIIIYKIRQFGMVLGFLCTYLILLFASIWLNTHSFSVSIETLWSVILSSALIFFTCVMVIEPQTGPGTKRLQLFYGVGIGLLTAGIQIFFPKITYNFELSLLIANLAFRLPYPSPISRATLVKKVRLASNIYGFYFKPNKPFSYTAGQFLEWTLPHSKPDVRGIRRFFTVASSPTEPYLLLTTKFSDRSSSFKERLKELKPNDSLTISGLEGDFVLPKDTSRPVVFIVGGIGITPVRSMVQWLLDTDQKRDISLLYSVKTADEIVFTSLWKRAEKELQANIVITVTEPDKDWLGKRGKITKELIKKTVYKENALYYISGPEPMVEALTKEIADLGVPKSAIVQDFFPGYPAF